MRIAPAAKVIELTNEIIDTRFNVTSKYTGKPSRELDDAWTNLVGNLHIRVSSEDLEQMKEKSIPLSDEKGGYLVGLGKKLSVTTGRIRLKLLHRCISSAPLSGKKIAITAISSGGLIYIQQYIRRMAYKEYYEELPMAMMHLDHCVESLRQVLMCMPNDGIMFFDWSPNLRGPVPRFQVWHQCMNWEKLDAWAAARTVSLYDTKAVVHPQYGIQNASHICFALLIRIRPLVPRRTGENLGRPEERSQRCGIALNLLLKADVGDDRQSRWHLSFGIGGWPMRVRDGGYLI